MGKFCKVCQITVQDENSWNFHIYGKKHLLALQNQQYREGLAERSVFITGFEKGTSQLAIVDYFMRFGRVSKVTINEKGTFAFVEFYDRDCVPAILSRRHFLGRKELRVKPRHIKPISPRRHIDDRPKIQSEEEKQNEINKQENILSHLKNAKLIDQQMDILLKHLQVTENEREFRFFVCRELEHLFRQYFAFFELHLFGSSMTKLGFHNCDLDVVLTLFPDERTPTNFQDIDAQTNMNIQNPLGEIIKTESRKVNPDDLKKTTMKNILSFIRKLLQSHGNFERVFIIPAKSAPLIRFTVNRNLVCDLSVKNKMAVYNSELIKFYLSLDERILPLMFSIKYWIKCHDLGGSGSHRLTSYALIMLVIFFLQNTTPAILPTVEFLQNINTSNKIFIDGWRCDFCQDVNQIPKFHNKQSKEELLKGFFQFYGNFDYSRVISPYSGKSLSRHDKANFHPNFRFSFICVHDPFELSRNIAANVIDKTAILIIQGFEQAYALLCKHSLPSCEAKKQWGLGIILDKNAPKIASSVERKVNLVDPNQKAVSFPISLSTHSIQEGIDTSEGCKTIIKQMQNAVILSLRALRFECCQLEHNHSCERNILDTMQAATSSNKRQLDDSDETGPSKKFIGINGVKVPVTTAVNSERISEKSNQDCVSDDNLKYVCKIQHRTWIGRKKMRNILSAQLPLTVLQAEEQISTALIESKSNPNVALSPCSYSFVLEITPNLQSKQICINVRLIPRDSSAELKGVVFNFLQSYLPKIVNRYLLERNLTV